MLSQAWLSLGIFVKTLRIEKLVSFNSQLQIKSRITMLQCCEPYRITRFPLSFFGTVHCQWFYLFRIPLVNTWVLSRSSKIRYFVYGHYCRIISSTNFNAQFSLFINNMFVTLLFSTCFDCVCSKPVYCADVYRERRYQMLCEYNFSSRRWAC